MRAWHSPVGWTADRHGPRIALLLGSVGMSLALFAIGHMNTTLEFYTIAVLVGNFTIIAVASGLLLAPQIPGVIPAFLVLHGFATAAEDVVVPLVVSQRFGTRNLGRI